MIGWIKRYIARRKSKRLSKEFQSELDIFIKEVVAVSGEVSPELQENYRKAVHVLRTKIGQSDDSKV